MDDSHDPQLQAWEEEEGRIAADGALLREIRTLCCDLVLVPKLIGRRCYWKCAGCGRVWFSYAEELPF